MSYSHLKDQVFQANLELERRGLVIYTFGNVSQIDRNLGVIAIKPSGVDYAKMKSEDMVIVDLDNHIIEGTYRPSSDTKTHTHLYKNFQSIGGITHTHSTYATAWAQAQQHIPCYGTTHADYVNGEIPCTAVMSDEQIQLDYEEQTGVQITTTLQGKNPMEIPMILVAGHAPFTWGINASESVVYSVILEELAKMAYLTRQLNPISAQKCLKQSLLDKHFQRKHGPKAYYGQK